MMSTHDAIEQALSPFANGPDADADMLSLIRALLRRGATIRAVDPTGPVLERLDDGTWHGGLDIQFPKHDS